MGKMVGVRKLENVYMNLLNNVFPSLEIGKKSRNVSFLFKF